MNDFKKCDKCHEYHWTESNLFHNTWFTMRITWVMNLKK